MSQVARSRNACRQMPEPVPGDTARCKPSGHADLSTCFMVPLMRRTCPTCHRSQAPPAPPYARCACRGCPQSCQATQSNLVMRAKLSSDGSDTAWSRSHAYLCTAVRAACCGSLANCVYNYAAAHMLFKKTLILRMAHQGSGGRGTPEVDQAGHFRLPGQRRLDSTCPHHRPLLSTANCSINLRLATKLGKAQQQV